MPLIMVIPFYLPKYSRYFLKKSADVLNFYLLLFTAISWKRVCVVRHPVDFPGFSLELYPVGRSGGWLVIIPNVY